MKINKSDCHEFLLSEFSIMAKAHFRTIEEISNFFKHYLVTMSLPAGLLGYIFLKNDKPFSVNSTVCIELFLGLIFLVIAVTGACIFCYIVNLRMDALLYARVINSIRGYYLNSSNLNKEEKELLSVLPQIKSLPNYHEKSYFWPVVISFSSFNTLYILLATIYLGLASGRLSALTATMIFRSVHYVIIPAIFFFILHFLLYRWYADYREYKYLKNNVHAKTGSNI